MSITSVYEGRTTWMYKDIAGVVTCGIGHALFSALDAMVIEWDQPKAQINADWIAVHDAPTGHIASWYEPLTRSRLSSKVVEELLSADMINVRTVIEIYFPDFNKFPSSAQEAIQDMAFNLGPHFPKDWPKFAACVLRHDWNGAADECVRRGISEARNKATQLLFQEAAIVSPSGSIYA